MRLKSLCIFLFIQGLFITLTAQQVQSRIIGAMPSEVSETSGLLFIGDRVITFNDSGNEAALYELDTTNLTVGRKVVISNAKNVDWEAITADREYIYIGDIGNNNGNRKDLAIYKVLIADFLTKTTVTAQAIYFKYESQEGFVSLNHSTRYDAEALAIINGELILFNKNWQENVCHYYLLSKTEPVQSISELGHFKTLGRITDAVYDESRKALLLIGMGEDIFLTKFYDFEGTNIKDGKTETIEIKGSNCYQVEGIGSSGGSVFCTSEEVRLDKLSFPGNLFEVQLNSKLIDVGRVPSSIKVTECSDGISVESRINKRFKKIKLETDDAVVLEKKVRKNSFFIENKYLGNAKYTLKIKFENDKDVDVNIKVF